MKIKVNNGNFEPCPEFTGKGVCVDVTPLRKQQSQYGERDVFKLVFEVDMEREDGSRFCVWSKNFTPSLGEKSNFRKFLRGWFGEDLSEGQLQDFDTETLLGKGAQLVVVQEHKDGKTYANIMACVPDRSGEALQASGRFVRSKDRGTAAPGPSGQPQGPGGRPLGQNGYRRAEQPAGGEEDVLSTKIHVGRCRGLEVRDLAPEQVRALVGNWLPGAKSNPKPTADDRRLIAALEAWAAARQKEVEQDNVPY